MIIVDTNVVSQFLGSAPSPAAVAWAEAVPPHELAMSVVTVQEVELGLLRLPKGRRRSRLEGIWQDVVNSYSARIVDYDVDATRAAAATLAHGQRVGRAMSLADAQIAGTCLAHGHRLATRNVKDFDFVPGLTVIDPFAE